MWVVTWSEAGRDLFAVRLTWRHAMDLGLLMADQWGCKVRIVHESRWRR